MGLQLLCYSSFVMGWGDALTFPHASYFQRMPHDVSNCKSRELGRAALFYSLFQPGFIQLLPLRSSSCFRWSPADLPRRGEVHRSLFVPRVCSSAFLVVGIDKIETVEITFATPGFRTGTSPPHLFPCLTVHLGFLISVPDLSFFTDLSRRCMGLHCYLSFEKKICSL